LRGIGIHGLRRREECLVVVAAWMLIVLLRIGFQSRRTS
jgi:hypothetical protein